MVVSRLAFINMKKKKSASAGFIFFILLATVFMNIGMMLMTESENFYDKKEAEINAPQFVASCSVNSYKSDFEEFIFNDDSIALAEKEEVIFMPNTKNNMNKSEQGAFIFNYNAERKIAPFIPIEEDKSIPDSLAIFVPVSLKDNNISVGDDFVLTYKNIDYKFKIAGFFETTYYSSAFSGYFKYFIPNERYQKLYSEIGRAVVISARFKGDNKDIDSISEDFLKKFVDKTDFNYISKEIMQPCLSAASIKYGCMSLINTIAAMLIAFALVICIIVIIVIYNHIVESIDESIQNIGVLQAIGYTTKQIMGSMIFEYMVLSIVGITAGILASYAALPFLIKLLYSTSLIWKSSLHLTVDLICIAAILMLILLTSIFACARILRLPPVKALNQNIGTHNFSKNVIPLHKCIGSLNFKIALKNLFSNIKSNISFAVIIASATFAIGLTIILFMNFAYDKTALYNMVGFELSDVQITVTDNTDTEKFAQKLGEMGEVRKTNLSDVTNVKIEDSDISVIVSDNFSAMEVLSVYEGSLPKYDNEIAITGVVSQRFNKKIGDSVRVTAEGRTKEYYITGIYQSSNAEGLMSLIPFDGIKKLRPQYKMKQIDLYLKDGIDKEAFKDNLRTIYKIAAKDDDAVKNEIIDETDKYSRAKQIADEKIAKLLSDYGVDSVSYSVMLDGEIILSGDSSAYKINKIADLKNYLDGQLNSYAHTMSGMVATILAVTLLITGGILSITIKNIIKRKRKEYGTYKAMGYTTKDLVKQLSLSFAITSIIGAAAGTVLITLFSDRIFQMLFASVGLTRVSCTINPIILIGAGIFIVVYLYFLAMLKAYKIKKITAYELLTE